jgi:hypothetical protein
MAGNGDTTDTGFHGKTRRGMSTLGQSVNRITTPAMRRRGFSEAAIVTRWAEIVGRPLFDHSRPFRVVFPRGQRLGGTLHLTVSGAFAPEVQHLSPQIIERINTYFGYGAIDRLELHHGQIDPVTTASPGDKNKDAESGNPPPPNAELAATIANVEDPDLREALNRLAHSRAEAGNKD